MSLVNDMLNDLEQRQRKGGDAPRLEVAAVGLSAQAKQTRSKWLMALFALLVVAIMLSVFLPKNTPPETVITARPLSPVVNSPVVNNPVVSNPVVSNPVVSNSVVSNSVVSNPEEKKTVVEMTQEGDRHAIERTVQKSAPASTPASTQSLTQPLTQPLIQQVTESTRQLEKRQQAPVSKTAANDATVQKVAKQKSTAQKSNATSQLKRKVPVDGVKTPVPITPEQLDKKTSLEAQQLIRKGDYRTAEQQLWRIVDGYADAKESQVTLITLLLAQQRYAQAQQLLLQAVSRHPDERRLLKLKSRYLLATGDQPAALVVLEAMPVNLNIDVEHVELMAATQQQLKNHQQAAQLYQQLVRHDADQAGWWIGFAVSLEAMGQLDSARSAYLRATQLPFENVALQQYVQQRLNALSAQQPSMKNR